MLSKYSLISAVCLFCILFSVNLVLAQEEENQVADWTKGVFEALGSWGRALLGQGEAQKALIAQESEQFQQEAQQQSRNLVSRMYNYTKNRLKSWFRRQIKQNITTPLENKVREGSGWLKERLIKIQDFFINIGRKIGIIKD